MRSDREKFEAMGIKENIPFQLRELVGTFHLHIEEAAVYDTSNNGSPQIVHGLYENLKQGKYHKKG